MSSTLEEPPGTMEEGPPEEPASNLKESCEQSKSQLESLKEIMLRNKQSLKKKEEEIQEYARKLTKFKTRAKLSKRSRDDTSGESTPKSTSEISTSFSENLEDEVDDISQAKTPKAKSSLLQRKLAEDKKIFEQRSREMTESKRAVEEKVEAIRQQLDEREQQMPLASVVLSQSATPLIQMSFQQDKDNKIAELSNKIVELEATLLDLRENLREKDSVIDSKTKAVTLMSADLSLKGKTTLDTLEDTKDEMRIMQEHFVLLETSLRSKNDNLLDQLREKNDRILEVEEELKRLGGQLQTQKLSESASVDFSRSTMDTLAETKEAMKSMQENFVLVESSLKSKNDHLLQQLEERETKLAEAKETIFKLESGVGISRPPEIEDLEYKLQKIEENNRRLQDEKFELQKNNVELQSTVISLQSVNGNGVIVEKDNRIAELESLIEELRKSNQLLEEESKAELQNQVTELLAKNEDISNKVTDLEKLVHDLETERNELLAKIPSESEKPDDKVVKLTKEVEEMNKGLIKVKAQHKSKVKNLQRQLESFRKVSDVNAELVRLGNQVALLEEEKGNLQLSLVDFDELKVNAGDWKEQITDLEGKVNAQAKEIQSYIDAIAALENQKLDIIQELHSVKQEVSALEEENAESENLRVTAEMKVVDLEEQLEAFNKAQGDQKSIDLSAELTLKIESLTKENEELLQKVAKLEEKGTSDSGSTESFETLQETDRSDLMKKIEELSHRNNELLKKLSTLEEKTESNVGSTESFETINDADKNDLLKRIDALTRENSDLVIKLSKIEEKGSSDTGSTESFEKIPEHSDSSIKIEMLTRENNNLVIQLTKLEEKLAEGPNTQLVKKLEQENSDLLVEIAKLRERTLGDDSEDFSQRLEKLSQEKEALLERVQILDSQEKLELEESQSATVASLESEIEACKKLIEEQKDMMEDMKLKLGDKEEELERRIIQIQELEVTGADVVTLRKDLEDSTLVIEEWKRKCDDMERKMQELEAGKLLIEEGLQSLQEENRRLVEEAEQKEEMLRSLKLELDSTISAFESKLEDQAKMLATKDKEILSLKEKIKNKEKDLTDKYAQLQNEMITIDSLQDELDQRKMDLQQKDAAIVSLTEEVNDLKVSRKWEVTSAKKHVEELKAQLQVAKSPEEFEEMINQLRDKDTVLNSLQTRVESQDLDIKDLQDRIESLRVKYEEAEADYKAEADKVDEANLRAEAAFRAEGTLKAEAELVKVEFEKQIEYLQGMLETNGKYAEDLKAELNGVYQELEKLKMKHVEDMNMQNRRLEEIIEDLQSKIQEAESLKAELEKSQMLVGQNVTEEAKRSLETKVSDLEQQLAESGEKSQRQIEKMKKLVVNLKKKSALCEELETKVVELEAKVVQLEPKVVQLEEALVLEKDEKEAKNREIQEKDTALKEKDAALKEKDASLEEHQEQISSLGARLLKVESVAMMNIEDLTTQLNSARERLDTLMKMIVEMGEESFEGMVEKCRNQQQELDEAKDNVRELSVRMQVMESEYVEQLSLIQSSKTENGMLLSKQAQINERLENAEKESEDRRMLLEQLQMELEKKETEIVELIAKRENDLAGQESGVSHQELRVGSLQESVESAGEDSFEGPAKCERCDQCQTLVHTLEARLQERDAQIENLDNELANSVANFVQMQDNLRINNLGQNRSLQESYNDLMIQYNTLTASNEEIKLKLNETIKENQELMEKIETLKELNVTLQERTTAVESELMTGKATAESLQSELEAAQVELTSAKSRIDESDLEKKSLMEKYQELEGLREILGKDLTTCRQKINELETELQGLKENVKDRPKRDLGAEPAPFFDASKAFGIAPNADQSEVIRLREALSEKESLCSNLSLEIERLMADQAFKTQELEAEKSKCESMRTEKEELVASYEMCRFKIIQLESDMKSSGDIGRITELEDRASKIQRENELFQLQVTDLTRALEFAGESTVPLKNLQDLQSELNTSQQERDQLLLQIDNLNQTLQSLEQKALEQNILQQKNLEKPVEEVKTSESAWETSVEKVEVEEEGWGWNPEDAAEHPITTPIISNAEIQLQMKIDELEDQLKDLQTDKAKILEDNSNIQTKCGKLIKKLKEYKFQVDNLQQQLKSRKLTSDLCNLDSVFNDEMNSQISGLEKGLAEAKEEHRKALAEKENLTKRLDVLMAANERHVEMKEKQDMQVEVLEIRNKELTNRLEMTQKQLQEVGQCAVSEVAALEVVDSKMAELSEKKYKQEIEDLKSSIDDLAAENDQLQHLLEEQRENRLVLELKLAAESAESLGKLQEVSDKNSEMQKALDRLKEEYSVLRKQYEQSLMDANDQVQIMRQNLDIQKEEVARKSEEFDAELSIVRKEAEGSVAKIREELDQAMREKEHLSEALNQRIEELQGLKKESEICTESLKGEAELQVLIQGLNQETDAKELEVQHLKKSLIEKEEELLLLKRDLESTNLEMQNKLHQMEAALQICESEVREKKEIVDSQSMEIERLVAALDEKIQKETELTQKVINLEADQQQYEVNLQSQEQNLQLLQSRIMQADHEINESRKVVAEKDSALQGLEVELQRCRQEMETSRLEIEQLISKLRVSDQELERISDLDDSKTESYNILNLELQTKKLELNDVKLTLLEKESLVEELKQKIKELNQAIEGQSQEVLERESVMEDLRRTIEELNQRSSEKESLVKDLNQSLEELRQKEMEDLSKRESGRSQKTADDVPIFRMGGDEVEHLKAELSEKESKIAHLESSLNDGTYTQIIQELQDTVNQLYNEKAHFESTFAVLSQNLKDQLSEKEREIKSLRQELEIQRQELKTQSRKEDSAMMSRRKRSMDEEDENQRLRDALRAWEQEVQDLRQMLAEKDAQLMQDSSGPDKEIIERLMSEKEEMRLNAEETLERKLTEKEIQIEEVKSRLEEENERLLNDLKLRERDLENLRIRMEETNSDHDEQLQRKSAEVAFAGSDLAEKDRRLSELSVAKEAEVQNLKVQIHDKEMKIEELQALSDEEERQLVDLKVILESRDQEMNDLKQQLEVKVKELEMIQNALRRHVTRSDDPEGSSLAQGESLESSANELDLALYMLHQRDVRCEELTLELMQLLEERDTLQLRLSNAIRVNEELRRSGSPSKSRSLSSGSLPLVEDPSPSRAEGPVEIAKDALDSSIGENKEALALKLSQLHTVGHSKDVRLRDDRELRHSQQMSLLAHKDVLSTLPPEAAARLINANYTLSRDVQSQSSVLMNWLWGKSTPKVMHM